MSSRLAGAVLAAFMLSACGTDPAPSRRPAALAASDPLARHLERAGTHGLTRGNRADLLIDGPATFDAMFASIAAARRTIRLESYIIEDAAVSQRLAQLLVRKAAAGVQVQVLYDGLGSASTPGEYFDELRAAGVAVCEFNPIHPLERLGYWNITQRDHRKILAVDARVAFTGGINISAVYKSGSFSRRRAPDPKDGWRDTQIRLQGPAAAALDALVQRSWNEQGCAPTPAGSAAQTLPVAAEAGPQAVRIVASSPDDAESPIYRVLIDAIDDASRSVHLTMAYFAPGDAMIDALCEAAGRGVDVVLVLPSVSDFTPVLEAGRSRYARLLAAGVRIHELRNAVLHAKTAVIDGVFSTVGSSNLDWRSFESNYEVNAVVYDAGFAASMEKVFERDVAASDPITPEAWQRRSLLQRAKEGLARMFERWW